ncbi:MAG TPA: hypothetical protein VNM69_05410 [Bacillus sp. (in: firmicutes)]|uniref:hypothetical protein n=1 Tax=Bacillus litorisediminis TaxID=2922713 RepID=UPI001FAB6177|nr:hypothetical protein [Bacillus litorisediminis]HWO75346.1 hypothetical protein [Bacillus sp. (in: firmicutes)]
MAKITTGPFRAPVEIPGANALVAFIIITLKNHTDEQKEVRVIVHECPAPVPPTIPGGQNCAVSPETLEVEICNENVVLNNNRCRQVFVIAITNRIYRVTISGDIGVHSEEVEVSVVGTDAGFSVHEPTMFFRHDDFIKVEDDDDDDD